MPREQEGAHGYPLHSQAGSASFPVPFHRTALQTPGIGLDPKNAPPFLSLPSFTVPRFLEWGQSDEQMGQDQKPSLNAPTLTPGSPAEHNSPSAPPRMEAAGKAAPQGCAHLAEGASVSTHTEPPGGSGVSWIIGTGPQSPTTLPQAVPFLLSHKYTEIPGAGLLCHVDDRKFQNK